MPANEAPADAEFVLDTTALEIVDAAERLYGSLTEAGLLATTDPVEA